MKKRRTLIISLLLVAALALGIGYAATSETLVWSGAAENEAIAFSVKFSNATEAVTAASTERETTIADLSDAGTPGGITITPEVAGLKEVGDMVVFTYTVTNYSDVDVKLGALEFANDGNNEYFSIEYGTWSETEIAPNGTSVVTVTVKLAKVSDIAQSTTFTINALAEPVNS